MKKHLEIAFNAQLINDLVNNGIVTEWWPLIPAGKFKGRDGRWWINDNPQAIIDFQHTQKKDIQLDVEHSSEIKAPKGEPAPARGWFKQFKIVEGAIYGRVELNNIGQALIDNREYKYYSPAFYHDPKTKQVTGLSSVGLTNGHNLYLPALNQKTEDKPMNFAAIAAILGLETTATEDQLIKAINQLKQDKEIALNQVKSPDLKEFVPKSTHDLVLNRAETAEQKLADLEKAQNQAKAEDLIDAAIEAKKVAPADREHYLTLCAKDGGFDSVSKILNNAHAIVGDEKEPEPEDASGGLSEVEKAVCHQLGISEADFVKAKA